MHTRSISWMAVNPSVEVYLLDKQGASSATPRRPGIWKRQRIALPRCRRCSVAPMPVYGDDPRSVDGRKVLSVAPLKVDGRIEGYLYVALLGEEYTALASNAQFNSAVRMALGPPG
ncbi:hypothetical protein M8494_17880 [Serratia ureilytica]